MLRTKTHSPTPPCHVLHSGWIIFDISICQLLRRILMNVRAIYELLIGFRSMGRAEIVDFRAVWTQRLTGKILKGRLIR